MDMRFPENVSLCQPRCATLLSVQLAQPHPLLLNCPMYDVPMNAKQLRQASLIEHTGGLHRMPRKPKTSLPLWQTQMS